MLEELYAIHTYMVKTVPNEKKRYLFREIDWNSPAICVTGARGTGKTTMLLQVYLEKYADLEKCLYISADNINVISRGLFKTAQEYFKYGGKALIIDEIHKYASWSMELKNILDTYKDRQILVSGSSTLDLKRGKYDLSRRMAYYELRGMSFREYLYFTKDYHAEVMPLGRIIQKHIACSRDMIKNFSILKEFREYLSRGYYPYFLEGKELYLNKVLNAVEKTLFEDIAVNFNMRQPKLPVLKKILYLISTAHPFVPNIDKMSRELRVSKEYIYNYLEYLELSGLITSLRPAVKGYRLIRKPGKIYLENTNLLYAITGSIKLPGESGTVRETFFTNQLGKDHAVHLSEHADFRVDNRYDFEVGGKSKKNPRINKSLYYALDGVEIGAGRRIPLYLFGFLY